MNCGRIGLMILALAFTLYAAGCGGLSKPFPEKNLHAIACGQPPASSATRTPLVLRVEAARVSTPYDASTFVYKMAPSKFTSDYYNGFIAPPARLLTGELIAWLAQSGPFTCVLDGNSAADYHLTLETNITALYGDYTPGQTPSAVIEARFFVIDSAKASYKVVLQKTYRETHPISGQGPEALVDAWQQACRRVFTALASDLQGIPAVAGVPATP